METTCFLSSNSFTKSIEFSPSVRVRVFSGPKRNLNDFHTKRIALSSTISCCHLSPSPAGDEYQPHLAADWRSYRAKLVANEQAFMATDASTADLDTVTEHNHLLQQVTVKDKWAHPIHEPEKGCLLIATDKLDGVHIFERTVILLLSVGPAGPYGVILNRPSMMSIKEMRSTVVDESGMFSARPLFFGGPLDEGLFLVSPKGEFDRDRVHKSGVFEEVMKGLYYGTKETAGCAAEMVKRNVVGIGDFSFFDGYCGWENDQLREEIMAGYWTLAASSPSVVGLHTMPTRGLWDEVLGLMGPKKVW